MNCPYYSTRGLFSISYVCRASDKDITIDEAKTKVFCKDDSKYPTCMVFQQKEVDNYKKSKNK
jgi:hypothetical protein